jgi:hypothetical protein
MYLYPMEFNEKSVIQKIIADRSLSFCPLNRIDLDYTVKIIDFLCEMNSHLSFK